MENLYIQLGICLKNIRCSKNYTQKFVADDNMSRSTYTKIEAGKIIPSTINFNNILHNLDISSTEFFLFIINILFF